MGRRKIEIQPITHERNRSVTFLKRKNGLFKKAYELGVLCSVDVAVIIFEERPGHHVKLYQYCSADIQDMVQRHLRHDGEKDTRGPNDFSGNANHKADDDDNDDERDDDDDDDPRRLKRTREGKMKPSSDMLDPYHRTSLPIPQPPQLPIHGSGQGHPISNDRGRLGGLHPHSRSPSDDPSNGPYPYVSSHNPAPFGGQGQYPTPRHNGSQYPFNFNNTPPSTFLPLQPDFPRGPTGTGSRGSGGGGGGGGYPLPPRSNSSGYEPGLYPGVMSSRSGPTHPPTSGGGGNDIFTAFLDSNDQRPGGAGSSGNASSQQGSSFVGLDWPVHNVPSAPGGGSTTSGNSSTGADPPNGGSSGSWIDYLSGPTNGGGGGGRESMSWERGGGTSTDLGHRSGDLSSIFSGGGGGTGDRGRPGGMNGGSGLVMGISGKRRLVEDEVSGNGLLPSPISANGKS